MRARPNTPYLSADREAPLLHALQVLQPPSLLAQRAHALLKKDHTSVLAAAQSEIENQNAGFCPAYSFVLHHTFLQPKQIADLLGVLVRPALQLFVINLSRDGTAMHQHTLALFKHRPRLLRKFIECVAGCMRSTDIQVLPKILRIAWYSG